MGKLSECILQDFSLQHEDQYNEYIDSTNYFIPPNYNYSLFFDPTFNNYKEMLNNYLKYKSFNLDKDCKKLNDIIKFKGNYRLSYFEEPRQTYSLIRENDHKIMGMIEVRCEYNRKISLFCPQITYEVRLDERRKGYGKMLVDLLLQNENLNTEWLYFLISHKNTASISFIESFHAEEIIYEKNESIKHYRLQVSKK